MYVSLLILFDAVVVVVVNFGNKKNMKHFIIQCEMIWNQSLWFDIKIIMGVKRPTKIDR